MLVLKQLAATDSDAGVRGSMIPPSSMLPSHRATSGGTPPRSQTMTCASLVSVSKALFRSKDAMYRGVLLRWADSISASNCMVAESVLRLDRNPCWALCRKLCFSHIRWILYRSTLLQTFRIVSSSMIGRSLFRDGMGSVSFWRATSHRHFHWSGIDLSVHARTMHLYIACWMEEGRARSMLFVIPLKPGDVFLLVWCMAAVKSSKVGGEENIWSNSRRSMSVLGCTIASHMRSRYAVGILDAACESMNFCLFCLMAA